MPGIFDYARERPCTEIPEAERQAFLDLTQSETDRRQEIETRKLEMAEAERAKAAITRQLEQGTPPQQVLVTALRAIGIVTRDSIWAEGLIQTLEGIFPQVDQQSLLYDSATAAQEKLDAMQAAFNARTRKQLENRLKDYAKLEAELKAALDTLNAIENPQEQEQPI